MPNCLAIGATATTRHPLPTTDDRSTLFYDTVVRPTCDHLGLTLLRADELSNAGLSADHLLRLAAEVDVVVADLCDSGQELVFALGMRHALGRCTVLVTEGSSSAPGTVGTPSVAWPPGTSDALTAREQLIAVLSDAVRDTGAAPVGSGTAVVPQPVPAQVPMPSSGAGPTDGPAEDAPGFFDLVFEAEAQLDAITGDMADVDAAVADLVAMVELVGEEMARVNHPGASSSMKPALIHRLAKAIDGPAIDLEAAAERFAQRMGVAVGAFGTFLEWTANTPRSEWPDGVPRLLDWVVTASSDVEAAADGYEQVTAVIGMMGAASRQLRVPGRRISKSLQVIFRSVAVVQEWRVTALALRQS
ncbi:hypothetical protein AB0O01_29075 [Streptomyces sp. NPDC093252]|uniref:hypothetical protein n=1 Tax=Streptomyces sp. NPDC093252 TaxID=3154980 RepID=UPI0034183E53